MPRGRKAKVINKVEVESVSMNSRISKENYDKMMSDLVSITIQNFYIQNRRGEAHIWKKDCCDYSGFRWSPKFELSYINTCAKPEMDNNYFLFSSFEEFDEQLKKQYICKHHVSCTNKCCAEYLTSPEEKCAICLSDVQIHLLEETVCGHKFCLPCLNTYVESKTKTKVIQKDIPCPTCRGNLRWCYCCNRPVSKCDHSDDDNDDDDDDE